MLWGKGAERTKARPCTLSRAMGTPGSREWGQGWGEKNLGEEEPKDGSALAWTPRQRASEAEKPQSLAMEPQAYSLVRSSFSL